MNEPSKALEIGVHDQRRWRSTILRTTAATLVLVTSAVSVGRFVDLTAVDAHEASLRWFILPCTTAVALLWPDFVRPDEPATSPKLRWILFALPWIGLLWATTPFGGRQFGGYDMSMMIDAGWRLHLGQRPDVDFMSPFPPAFLALTRIGVEGGWFGLVHIGAAHTLVATAIAIFALSRIGRTDAATIAIVSAGLVAPFTLTTHLWHSLAASQAAAACLLIALAAIERPDDRWTYGLAGVCAGWAACHKPNVGIPAAMLSLLLISVGRSGRALRLRAWFLAILTIVAACLFTGSRPDRVLSAYLELAHERGSVVVWTPPGMTLDLTLLTWAGYLLPPVMVGGLWLQRVTERSPTADGTGRFGRPTAVALTGFVCLLVAALGLRSNWDLKPNDWPLLWTGWALLLPLHRSSATASPLVRGLASSTLVFLAIWCGLSLGASRLRHGLVGHHAFFEYLPLHRVNRGFLAGIEVGPRMHRVGMQIGELLAHVPGSVPVFFGPRLEFLYAQTKRSSPTGLPVWWHPGTSFRLEDTPQIVTTFFDKRFTLAIFLKDEFYGIPSALIDRLESDYARDDSFEDLTVFRPK